MSLIKDMWAIRAAAVMAWLSRIDNEVLNTIVNLLTITVILIGLTDWAIRTIRGRKAKKQNGRSDVLGKIESTQKPFKTVNMLDNPMGTSEAIGNFVDKISDNLKGGAKMKKFFKWVWYNKEQLFSILYSVALMALSQMAIWTGLVTAVLPQLPATAVLVVKAVICGLSLVFTALTVRNVCVTYGLSSLDTIDKVLAERAKEAANKLTPEQKKVVKSYISTLTTAANQAKADLAAAEKALNEITTLFNADSSLVANYNQKKTDLSRQIENSKALIANVEKRIADYKAQLSGKK